jgi:hypothetical protein
VSTPPDAGDSDLTTTSQQADFGRVVDAHMLNQRSS